MKVRDLFEDKIRPLHIIEGHRSIDQAIDFMAGKQANALIVTENEKPIGIFTKSDVYRYYLRDKTKAFSKAAVQDAMTGDLIGAGPDDDIGRVMAIMIKAHIRHLPVIDNKKLIGLLALSDLIEHQIESLNEEINQLKDYIEDLHEAGRD